MAEEIPMLDDYDSSMLISECEPMNFPSTADLARMKQRIKQLEVFNFDYKSGGEIVQVFGSMVNEVFEKKGDTDVPAAISPVKNPIVHFDWKIIPTPPMVWHGTGNVTDAFFQSGNTALEYGVDNSNPIRQLDDLKSFVAETTTVIKLGDFTTPRKDNRYIFIPVSSSHGSNSQVVAIKTTTKPMYAYIRNRTPYVHGYETKSRKKDYWYQSEDELGSSHRAVIVLSHCSPADLKKIVLKGKYDGKPFKRNMFNETFGDAPIGRPYGKYALKGTQIDDYEININKFSIFNFVPTIFGASSGRVLGKDSNLYTELKIESPKNVQFSFSQPVGGDLSISARGLVIKPPMLIVSGENIIQSTVQYTGDYDIGLAFGLYQRAYQAGYKREGIGRVRNKSRNYKKSEHQGTLVTQIDSDVVKRWFKTGKQIIKNGKLMEIRHDTLDNLSLKAKNPLGLLGMTHHYLKGNRLSRFFWLKMYQTKDTQGILNHIFV
jgi:hypothetical protein